MGEVKDAMVGGVRDNMIKAVSEYGTVPRTQWMQTWAAQCVLNGSQCHWTREVEALLEEKGNRDYPDPNFISRILTLTLTRTFPNPGP